MPATICVGPLSSSLGSVIAGLTLRSSGPMPPSTYSGPWIAAATWCSWAGKNFSGWIGSVAGAFGFDVTLIVAGIHQSPAPKVIDGKVQPAGVGLPGGGAVHDGDVPALNRVSSELTSVWPSVRMKTLTGAAGAEVSRIG